LLTELLLFCIILKQKTWEMNPLMNAI